MFRRIVAWSLKYRFIVLALSFALVLIGVDQIRDLRVDVFPEFAPPIVEIQTPCLGLAPTEVEALVTIPIEQALAGVPSLDLLRSKSVTDLSSVKLIFKQGTDAMLARQHVQEGLAKILQVIPKDVGPPVMLQPLSATARFVKIGLSSEKLSLVEQSMIAYWTIRPRLLAVPGVANVAIWGERIDMLQVQVEPEKLQQHGVSIQEVMDATSDALEAGLMSHSDGALIGTGGFIDSPNQRITVRNKLPIVDPEGIGEVAVYNREGRKFQIKDVAQMVWGHQPLVGDAVVNGGPGLLLIVEKFPWANSLQVTKGVDDALTALRPGLPDLEIDSAIFRPATFVELSIKNLTNSLILGSLLLIVVLALFLYNWRVALITCVAIPLSLMAALMVLHARGTVINTMILAGFVIALGALVDDAIVGMENIARRLREHRREGGHGRSVARVILEAVLEVRHAIVYATLIEVVALLPVFFLGGLSGAFFRPLAFSYALSLLASMVVALSVTPAMAYILVSRAPLSERESPLVRWLQSAYMKVLAAIVPRPKLTYATVGLIALGGVLIVPRLGQSLLPDFKERDFLMHWLAEPGTSVTEEFRISAAACDELMKIPGVLNCGSHIGQALIMDEVYGVYFGENWVSVDPSVDYDKTLAAIQAAVDGYPGLVRDVQTYLKERIREVLTGSPTAITVRIFGDDLKTIRDKADEVKHAFEDIPGVVDLKVESQKAIPQIDVEVNLAAAERYGVKPGDVRRMAAAMISGTEVGDIFRDGKAYDVNVWSTPDHRNSLGSIQNLPMDTPRGQVPLKELADVRIVATPNHIDRWQMKRKIDVRANVRGRDLGSVVADVREKLATVPFPAGYHPELLGEYAEREAAQKKMRWLMVVSAIGILLMLQASFVDWRLALVGYLALPAALVGGILAAYLGDGVISLGSIVGFLTVLGIAARNGIMLINHYQHLERHEGEPFGMGLVLRGARERISPILMTASTTALALVPLLIAGTIPGHEIEHPMAMVIVGGLVTSTLLNLFVMPSLYLRFARPMTQPAPERAT